MKKECLILILISGFLTSNLLAQPAATDSTLKPEIKLSGFVDVFYAFDFNKPQTSVRQPFLYNHNRHNEFNLNLGLLKVAAAYHQYRANLAFQAGTYALDNYATDPLTYKHIAEANVGVSLTKAANVWFDAGIFASHIGFESAVSSDNWTLTRSLLAENSPYYLAGAKLTYNPTQKLVMAALICNGWQRIQRVPGNSLPGFGTQFTYAPHDKLKLNWSTFVGTDDPDSIRRMRYFNNFYGQIQITNKFGFIAGFDIGTQQRRKKSTQYDTWFSPVLIGRYSFTQKIAAALRLEYYSDPTGIIIPLPNEAPFKTKGFSLNVDYLQNENVMLRLEGRWLQSKQEMFSYQHKAVKDNFFIVSSMAVKF